LAALEKAMMTQRVSWVLDLDIRTFFGSVDHRFLNTFWASLRGQANCAFRNPRAAGFSVWAVCGRRSALAGPAAGPLGMVRAGVVGG
jgi:hypothetical protein